MTAIAPIEPRSSAATGLTSRLINQLLAIRPLFNLARRRARRMMIQRAESIGVPWQAHVEQLRSRAAEWESDLAAARNPQLQYPDYYLTSFHAYEEGNLGWLPAMEVEVAAQAVHARIWPEAAAQGDAKLRQSYHQVIIDVLTAELAPPPSAIVDLGCGVGMSTLALQQTFPAASLTGVDLSPYFLAVAQHRLSTLAQEPTLESGGVPNITWHHAAAEATGLPAAAYDLVSACLMFHELPQSAAIAIIQEARRLLRPGGHLAIMDMNPGSEVFTKMPPFVLTLLKSTEPYLDQYFALPFTAVLAAAGFEPPTLVSNSPRHHTLMARAC